MANIRFAYDNYWNQGTFQGRTTEHPQFLATDSQVDTKMQVWRSRYGAGSGNGTWVAVAGEAVDFDEGGAEFNAVLGATTTASGNDLASDAKAKMDTAGGQVYTVSYSSTTGKYTFSAPGNFTLRWLTGTNQAKDNNELFGFNKVNKTGTNSYTSDVVVIHDTDFGTEISIDGLTEKTPVFCGLINHNISASATAINVQGADDANFSVNLTSFSLTQNASNIYEVVTGYLRRYWRILIVDSTNSNMYIQIGYAFLGTYFEMNRHFLKGYSESGDPLGDTELSDAGSVFGDDRPVLKTWTLPFKGLNDTAVDNVNAMFQQMSLEKAFIMTIDPDNYNTTSFLVRFKSFNNPRNSAKNYWNWTANLIEVK